MDMRDPGARTHILRRRAARLNLGKRRQALLRWAEDAEKPKLSPFRKEATETQVP